MIAPILVVGGMLLVVVLGSILGQKSSYCDSYVEERTKSNNERFIKALNENFMFK